MLSYRFAKRHQVLYLTENEENILYFVGNLSPLVLQTIQKQVAGQPFSLRAVESAEFLKLLERHYQGQTGSSEEAMAAISEAYNLSELSAEFEKAADLLDSEDDAPIIKLINSILTTAIKQKASDIHIESFEHRIAIRLRIDGVLKTVMEPPVALAPFLVARVKVMAGLDIAEKRLPQDGRISLQMAGRAVDIRVSTLPVANHERVVLRVLDKAANSFTLQALGLPDDLLPKVQALIERPHGIFLVVGPTGSGKTTTLYAALSALNLQTQNIMTVEDPIEYFLDGISQTQVNAKIGMTFSRGLRAILRQDPDIIMVGEIRDLETAEMAIQSSLTGHMVFSTLHTNTAIGAVMRLKDMGIEPFLLSAALSGVLSQRLIRKLCPHCKKETAKTVASEKWIGDAPHFSAVGCEACNQTGYQGRIGIYELVVIDDVLREMIVRGDSELAMQNYAKSKTRLMPEEAKRLLREGVTSLAEVLRVTVE